MNLPQQKSGIYCSSSPMRYNGKRRQAHVEHCVYSNSWSGVVGFWQLYVVGWSLISTLTECSPRLWTLWQVMAMRLSCLIHPYIVSTCTDMSLLGALPKSPVWAKERHSPGVAKDVQHMLWAYTTPTQSVLKKFISMLFSMKPPKMQAGSTTSKTDRNISKPMTLCWMFFTERNQ